MTKKTNIQPATSDDETSSPSKKSKLEIDDMADEETVKKLLEVQKFAVRPVKQTKSKKRDEETDPEDLKSDIHPAIQYLMQWHNNEDGTWKFKKVRQIWLLQNMYDKEKMSKEHFKIMLRYIADLKGKSKDATFETAQNMVESEEEIDKRRLKRATKVLKIFIVKSTLLELLSYCKGSKKMWYPCV